MSDTWDVHSERVRGQQVSVQSRGRGAADMKEGALRKALRTGRWRENGKALKVAREL